MQLVVVDLSRNFGHHRALMVGLSYATGDLVFMIDVDLEEEPELLREFYARFLQKPERTRSTACRLNVKVMPSSEYRARYFTGLLIFWQATTLPATPL